MGNETSTPPPEPEPAPIPENGYKWPDNIYDEMHDMGAVAFLVYTFGIILQVSRKVKEESGTDLVGLNTDNLRNIVRSGLPDSELERSFTPMEVSKLIEDNKEALYSSDFDDFFKDPRMLDSLKALVERVGSAEGRPLALEEYDDKFQEQEMVYAVCRDSLNKRITIVFRGTENKFAMKTNWMTNIHILKVGVEMPDVLIGKLKEDPREVRLHSGFYNYIFSKTVEETDAPELRKYDQILADVKPLLEKYPDHKLYLTGHSLGAALSTIMAFFLSCDPDMPKPVSCINFASPRVGDETFLAAVQHLEKTRKLRMLRVVNENDSITTIPTIGYDHVGFQATLYKKSWLFGYKEPVIHYPKVGLDWGSWLTIGWRNSTITSLNLGYDHSDYRERVDEGKDFLSKKDLNAMYNDPNVTGYVLGVDE